MHKSSWKIQKLKENRSSNQPIYSLHCLHYIVFYQSIHTNLKKKTNIQFIPNMLWFIMLGSCIIIDFLFHSVLLVEKSNRAIGLFPKFWDLINLKFIFYSGILLRKKFKFRIEGFRLIEHRVIELSIDFTFLYFYLKQMI